MPSNLRARGARGVLGASVVIGVAGAGPTCNVYEGRSLDLFPAPVAEVECRSASQCPRERPICSGGACVECSSSDHCGVNQRCNTVLNECALACVEASDCAGQAAARCSAELDLCVECLADGDCMARAPECGAGGACVECVSGAFCPENRPVCEPERQRCVECMSSADCSGLVCDEGDFRCVDCLRDADCAPTGTCDVERRRCRIPCSGPDDCEPMKPLCDEGSGLCIQCLSDANCADPKRPACDLERQCVECTRDDHCPLAERNHCLAATQRCGECSRPEHCPEGSMCDLREARCAPPVPMP